MLSEGEEEPFVTHKKSKDASSAWIKSNPCEEISFGAEQREKPPAQNAVFDGHEPELNQSMVEAEVLQISQSEISSSDIIKHPLGMFLGEDILNLLGLAPLELAENPVRNSDIWSFGSEPN